MKLLASAAYPAAQEGGRDNTAASARARSATLAPRRARDGLRSQGDKE